MFIPKVKLDNKVAKRDATTVRVSETRGCFKFNNVTAKKLG